jgi:hypothetical protein
MAGRMTSGDAPFANVTGLNMAQLTWAVMSRHDRGYNAGWQGNSEEGFRRPTPS